MRLRRRLGLLLAVNFVGDAVRVRGDAGKWSREGFIIQAASKRSYWIELLDGTAVRRNIKFIKKRKSQ